MKSLFPEAVEHVSPFPVEMAEVSFGYNGSPALRELSFRLPAGGRVAVVGPNGAGKTTLFKLIAGALRPSQGSIRVFGHGAGGHVCIAYVPQRSLIDWSFPVTVAEVVMMGRVRKIGFLRRAGSPDRREVKRALEQVGLQDLGARQIGELSGGEQQRAFLAQALAQGAELILLDEPLTGLDAPSQDAILRVLDELRTSGVTVMVATHDLNLASERFDQVMLLNHRLIALGSPAEVLTKDSLLRAYGGHLHALRDEAGVLVLTDTHCEGEDEAA
ncbi:MAG: metal ABC transporter ATP-binding protein [Anaerolineales bacterium]